MPLQKIPFKKIHPFTKFYSIKSYFSLIIFIFSGFKMCNLDAKQVHQKRILAKGLCSNLSSYYFPLPLQNVIFHKNITNFTQNNLNTPPPQKKKMLFLVKVKLFFDIKLFQLIIKHNLRFLNQIKRKFYLISV